MPDIKLNSNFEEWLNTTDVNSYNEFVANTLNISQEELKDSLINPKTREKILNTLK